MSVVCAAFWLSPLGIFGGCDQSARIYVRQLAEDGRLPDVVIGGFFFL